MANITQKICLKQEPGEDWCFECKDGGELVICDHRNCGKVYHPDCVGKDGSFFGSVESWFCGRHYCFQCNKRPKFYCLGCPNAVCKKCLAAPEFTVVRGVKGLCIDCLELVEIIEHNLEHDSEGNKISLDDVETYEYLFKEYWKTIKVKEGLTSDDVSAAQLNNKKSKNFLHQKSFSKGEEEKKNESMSRDSDEDYKPTKLKRSNSEEFMGWGSKEGLTGDDVSAAQLNNKTSKNFLHQKSFSKGEAEKKNESISWDSDEAYKPTKRKRSNSEEFMGWGSKPLINFLESIGKYKTQPLTKWSVKSLIYEYIKEKDLHHPKDKRKFLPDEKLFPIFRKKVMPKTQIYALLEFHFAKNLDGSSREKNDDKIKNSSTDKHLNDQTTCMESGLSSLRGKPLLKKGDLYIKPSPFASINASNINLIYLKQSLVLELSKEPRSFMGKVVGTFVRTKVDSNNSRQRMYHHLVRVLGVVLDEKSNGIFLQVSFVLKAIPISELSDEDFTEQECQALQEKVKNSLLPKLTVVELQEKAKSLHEDITKHRILTRLVYLQNQIDRANLRGLHREKFALLDEREKLEQSWKQEELLRHVPSAWPELIEAKYDDSEEDKLKTDRQDH